MNKYQRDWKLKNYWFRVGDKHNAVIEIKRFLNSHPRATLVNLSLDNTFDERTQSPISEFQRHKIIRQSQSATTNGSVMTPEIYKAIGESMSAV